MITTLSAGSVDMCLVVTMATDVGPQIVSFSSSTIDLAITPR